MAVTPEAAHCVLTDLRTRTEPTALVFVVAGAAVCSAHGVASLAEAFGRVVVQSAGFVTK